MAVAFEIPQLVVVQQENLLAICLEFKRPYPLPVPDFLHRRRDLQGLATQTDALFDGLPVSLLVPATIPGLWILDDLS